MYRVFYKKSGKYIFNNFSYDYRAYHLSVDLAQTKFISYEEAVAFTKAYKNTRVVHHPTGKVVWSNYLVKRFDLVNANAIVTNQYFREHQAVNDAITQEKVTVKDNVSSSIVYSSIVTPSFDVYHATKGKLKSFFNQEEAIAYAKLWPSTRVANNTNHTTIYTNTNTTKVAKTSVTVKGQTRMVRQLKFLKCSIQLDSQVIKQIKRLSLRLVKNLQMHYQRTTCSSIWKCTYTIKSFRQFTSRNNS